MGIIVVVVSLDLIKSSKIDQDLKVKRNTPRIDF
jgi:hypothetical protein